MKSGGSVLAVLFSKIATDMIIIEPTYKDCQGKLKIMGNKIHRKTSTQEADRLLGEQFLKEAEEAEARLLAASGGNAWKVKFKDSPEKKKAGYERLIAHLKATGKYREDQDQELILMQRIKKLQQNFLSTREKYRKEDKWVQITGMTAVIVFIFLIAGMITQTDPDLFKKVMVQFIMESL